jgi:site-specific DNA recombinase
MHIALYVRVSSQRQAQTQTIEQQLERLQAHVQTQGWVCPDAQIFRDDGYSGASLKRPGLDRLRDQVAQARFDRVLITAPDRLARKYVHQMLLLEEFERSGCPIEFVERPMSADPHDQLLLQIRGAVAEYERTLIADRMRRGRQQKYRHGQLLPWSRPPYGYRLHPDRPRDPSGVRLDDTEAAHVRTIFSTYLTPGQTLRGVTKQLYEAGVPAPSGQARWGATTVRGVLSNPVYTGQVYAGRERSVPKRRRLSALQPGGHRPSIAPTLPADWILVAQVPAVVSSEEFEQAAAKLGQNQALARRNNTVHPYLLRALVSCGKCKAACMGRTRGTHAYYCCLGRQRAQQKWEPERCRARYYPVAQLDAVVWQDLCELVREPSYLTAAFARAQGGAWLPQELTARRQGLRKATQTIAGQVERLTEAYLAQVLNLDEYKRRRQELEARQTVLESQLRQVEGQVHQHAELTGVTESMTDFCERVAQGLAEATFEQKRQLVELLIDRVVVSDEEVEIRYVIPTSLRSERVRFCQLCTDYRDAMCWVMHMYRTRP